MDQRQIGRFIMECRKEKGLTQAQLAEILGVSDKSVSRWENGKTMPDLSLYEPLCKALNVEVSELLYGKRLSDSEKVKQGEKTAMNLFQTKAQLRILVVLTEILIVIGIMITITFTALLSDTAAERVITLVFGSFVWGFGLVLQIKVKVAISAMQES